MFIYIYMHIYNLFREPRRRSPLIDCAALSRSILWRELRVSQGVGVASDDWFDRVLLSILHMFKPSC